MTRAKATGTIFGLLLAGTVAFGHWWAAQTEVRPTEYITYKRVVYQGDTLWDIVGDTNRGREDLQALIYRVRQDNGIKDAGTIQPGQELTIRIRKR